VRSSWSGCHLRSTDLTSHAYPPECSADNLGRERLLRRYNEEYLPLSVLAAQAGISVRTDYKWLIRYRSGGASALVDQRSVSRSQRRTLDSLQLQRVVDRRQEPYTLRSVAKVLAAPLSTVGRVLKAIGLGRVKNLQPAEPVRRYQ